SPVTSPPVIPRAPRLRRPGYFQCKHILERLHRFQDLVRHDQRWGTEIGFARPLEQLLPKGTRPENRPTEIHRQIHRLVPLVIQDLKRGGIPMEVEWPNRRYDPEKQRVVEEHADRAYHLIGDYFQL